MCNLFTKYPFLFRVSTKSAQSLCACLQELMSQYKPPHLLFTDNGLPFISKELAQFLQCNNIGYFTSSPHFPRSNGFTECQVRTLKTALSIIQDSRKTLEDMLLDLLSKPIRSNMPSSQEILHNRIFQQPGRSSMPVSIQRVCYFLLSHKQAL